MKTLDQIEPRTPISSLPFTITQTGSYYLAKNLTIAGAADGITIQADNVIIDLCGFTIDGAGTGRYGIITDSTTVRHGLQIRHGTFQNWTQAGLALDNCFEGIVEDIVAHNNAIGIRTNSCILRSCFAQANSSVGITVGSSVLRDCSVAACPTGIAVFSSTLRDSRVATASNTGIDAQNSTVENCFVTDSHYGIVGEGNANICHNEIVDSGSDGIRIITGTSVVADNNVVRSGLSVSSSGIWVSSSDNRILSNHVTHSIGLGIGVTGSYNTVDGNSVVENSNVGISVSIGTKNTIVRNSSLGNDTPLTNYSIASGNNPGPIDSAASSTNSWSNTQ